MFKHLAIAVALLCSSQAMAADFTVNGRYISVTDIIQKRDADKFLDIAQDRHIPTTVLFNSNGGSLADAAWIGQIIRMRGWSTAVARNTICNSACPLMWLAGVNRGLESRLGFHTAIKLPIELGVRHEQGNAYIAQYMRSMGAPQSLIDLQPKADACCFNYINAAQAKAWGLLDAQRVPTRTDSEIDGWLVGLRQHIEDRRS